MPLPGACGLMLLRLLSTGGGCCELAPPGPVVSPCRAPQGSSRDSPSPSITSSRGSPTPASQVGPLQPPALLSTSCELSSHALHQTLPGLPLLLSSQFWHCHLSVKIPPMALTSHSYFCYGKLMDAVPTFLPEPADFSERRGHVLPGSSLTDRTWDFP